MGTKMTVHGISTTINLGQEQFEKFEQKYGGKKIITYHYDYRHYNGELFTCCKSTLEECRDKCNEWIKKQN